MIKIFIFIALFRCTLYTAQNNSDPLTSESHNKNARNFTAEIHPETWITDTIQRNTTNIEIETLTTTASGTNTHDPTSAIGNAGPNVTKTFEICFQDEEPVGATCLNYITRAKFKVIVILLGIVVFAACALSTVFFCTCACSKSHSRPKLRLSVVQHSPSGNTHH